MPQTPNGYPYPDPNDVPDVPADLRDLAEAVDASQTTNAAAIADLTARVAALETGTGGAGWIPIASGSNSGASFSIDLTAGGKFPSPPLWSIVRVYMRVDLDAVGEVRMTLNGDTDGGYRSGSFMLDSESPANSDPESWHREAATSWSLAQLSTISTGNLNLTLFHTSVNPGLINFQCLASRHSETASFHRNQMSSGGIASTKTLQSLLFATGNGASTFVNCWWWAEGLRMVHPS